MKKILLVCIIIVGIAFVTGCIGGEKVTESKTITDTQINKQSDAQISDLILKPSDVPGLTQYKFKYFASPKSHSLINVSSTIRYADFGAIDVVEGIVMYEDALPIGNRNVGQYLSWRDNSGRNLIVSLTKFDSNSKFKEYFANLQAVCENRKTGKGEKAEYIIDEGCDSPNIGDNSYYVYSVYKNSPDVKNTELEFAYSNYYVYIKNVDEKDKSLNEAIRIAKIIKDRLD